MNTLDDDAPTVLRPIARLALDDAPTVAPPPSYPARYLPSPRVPAPRPTPRPERREPAPVAPAPTAVVSAPPPRSSRSGELAPSASARFLVTLLVASLAAMAGAALGSALTTGRTEPPSQRSPAAAERTPKPRARARARSRGPKHARVRPAGARKAPGEPLPVSARD